ncbi:MAG: hypothetical protein AMXMBFR45_08610 [Gammaproteobacteria bacterium]|nr:MAG: hypothetical protein EDM71_09155 [Pseudomonadota bacterium]MBC6946240.1 hypothetical protein [Gammaproteobacteria bacterium]MCE7897270.1 hypothetical protein [Gammaproteobacteria bacterium PRO8]MDL1881922.1 hypothetical protein [Gammaproteobacteria bacterium PRO2]GIK34874.1 MAG: 2-dehydro-3-deoxyglucarate aldolase [Gammaproteobacteria bacterium]
MTTNRRPLNAVKRRLQAGEVAVVTAGHSGSADTIDLMGSLGLDGFWIEGEHGPLSWDRLGDQSRAADLWGMSALVRVSRLDASLIVRALSLGAHGIVVPGVRTADEARAIVRAVKFAPVGERGVTLGRRSYGRSGFLHDENAETVVVVQLEDPEALANAEAIAAVEHLDVAMVAQNDLAQSMGHLGNPAHPEVQRAMASTLSRIAALGPGHAVAGANIAKTAEVAATLALGVRFLYASYDAWLGAAARDYLGAVRIAPATGKPWPPNPSAPA